VAEIENNPVPVAEAGEGGEKQQQRGERGGFGGSRGPGRGRRPRNDAPAPSLTPEGNEIVEKVVFINRSSKVVKGGRRFKFSALVVCGDKKGSIGVGLGKGVEVSDAIKKGGELAKRNMSPVALRDTTIPHEIYSSYDGAKILLRPASPGTGIIAGKTVRAVLESVGIKDILSKSLGSKNAANVVRATMNALFKLRTAEDICRSRGIEYKKPAQTPATVTA